MKPNTILFYTILMFVIKANCQNNSPRIDTVNVHTNKLIKISEKPIIVSVKELIDSPEKYYGKLIQVFGYLQLEVQESFLFDSQKSFEVKNTKIAIPFYESREDIYVIKQKFKNQYSFVTAKFGRIESIEFVGALYMIKSIDILKE